MHHLALVQTIKSIGGDLGFHHYERQEFPKQSLIAIFKSEYNWVFGESLFLIRDCFVQDKCQENVKCDIKRNAPEAFESS